MEKPKKQVSISVTAGLTHSSTKELADDLDDGMPSSDLAPRSLL